jgi:hypothetical protein
MQWRWFCKFPQPPIPTKRHLLHESRLVPDQHKHHRFPTLECLEPTMTWAEVSIFLL